MITEAFAISFDVGIRSICFAFIGGVLLGTLAAIKRGKAADTVAMIIALLGVSVPSFVVASVLQYFLGLKLYMATGMRIFAITGWEGFNSHILPVVALGFGSLATISRLMRTSMLDVLGQDYIKTAKAKGLSQSGIIFKHAMRNAIMPNHGRHPHRRLRRRKRFRYPGPRQVFRAEHSGSRLHHDLRHHGFLRRVPYYCEPRSRYCVWSH